MPLTRLDLEVDTAERMRGRAEECRRMAWESRDPRIAEELGRLAEAYLERAEELERAGPKL